MTVYDATSIEAERRAVIRNILYRESPVAIDANVLRAMADQIVAALPVSPVPTTGEASEPSPLSEQFLCAGVGPAPCSAADGGSDALGETVEKLREAVATLASVRMEISLERWGQLSSDILAAATLLTALEQRGDGPSPKGLERKVSTLQMLLARYGDRIRMASAIAWQQEIDEALAGRCPKCGGLHLGMAGDCMGPPVPALPSTPLPMKED